MEWVSENAENQTLTEAVEQAGWFSEEDELWFDTVIDADLYSDADGNLSMDLVFDDGYNNWSLYIELVEEFIIDIESRVNSLL